MTHQPDLPEELMFPPGMLPPVPEPYTAPVEANLKARGHLAPGLASPPLLRFAGHDFTDLDLGPRAVRLPLDGEWVRILLEDDAEIEIIDEAGIGQPGMAPAGSTVYFKIGAVGCARWEPNAHTTGSWLFLATVNSKLLWISQLDGPDANAQFIWQAHNEFSPPLRPAGRAAT